MGGARLTNFRAATVSAAVVSAAVALRLAGPWLARIFVSGVPKAYDSLVSWLAPPYLYIVINGIILSIAASSRFHYGVEAVAQPAATIVVDSAPYEKDITAGVVSGGGDVDAVAMKEAVTVSEEDDEEDFVISRSNWEPERRESVQSAVESPVTFAAAVESPVTFAVAPERPLVSERIGHRRSMKPSPDGKSLRRISARPKRNETLESTWRTITEGRAVPLARHLRKSDTYDGRSDAQAPESNAVMHKSETFNTTRPLPSSPVTISSPGSNGAGRLRREASLGHDELNRRVEAFIRKFNEEMRLQRQESFKQYMEMMNKESN